MSLLTYQPTREERQLAKERSFQKRQDAELLPEQARRERQIDEKANLQKQLVRDRERLEELEEDEDVDESSIEDLESWISDLESEISEMEQGEGP